MNHCLIDGRNKWHSGSNRALPCTYFATALLRYIHLKFAWLFTSVSKPWFRFLLCLDRLNNPSREDFSNNGRNSLKGQLRLAESYIQVRANWHTLSLLDDLIVDFYVFLSKVVKNILCSAVIFG